MGRERNTDYQGRSSYIASKCGEDRKWKLYIIAAEGDKTEPQYFNAFTIKYQEDFQISKIHVEYIDREEEKSTNSDPKYVYQTLLQFSQELEKKYDLQEYDELWIIIDTDDYDNRKQTISDISQKCFENPIYKLCISNPCFEIWLILHFFDLETNLQDAGILEITEVISLKNHIQSQYIKKRPGICKKLWNTIHQSKKQPSYGQLIEYIPEAISRSKMLDDLNINDPDYPEYKIGTEVYKLLDKLIKLSINLDI